MSRKKRYYRSAIVVTVAVSAATSCGGTTNDDSAATGGQATGGNGMHSGGQSTGGSSGGQSTGGHTGATDSGGNEATGGSTDVRRCTSEDLYYMTGCDVGDECLVDMDCTSGVSKAIYLRCVGSGMGWAVDNAECENPAEECQGHSVRVRCDGEEWRFHGGGGNPPAPCPLEQPEEGSSCRYGFGFGADPDACGYPCDDDGWTVVGCQIENPDEPEPGEGSWQSDRECSLGGAGGGAP